MLQWKLESTPISLITNNLTAEDRSALYGIRRISQSYSYLQVTFATLCGFFAFFAF